MRNILFATFILTWSLSTPLCSQVIISSETFNEAANSTSGTMSGGEPWTANGNNCDATGFFGVNAGAFVCTDYEGFNCCECVPNSGSFTCGDASNEILLGPINISAYNHISIDVFASQVGDMECVVGGNPNAPCPTPPITGCNGGNDQMVFSYSIDGGPDVVFQYYCGDNALCYSQIFACNIFGNSLTIKVLLGAQATGETYRIEDIIVYGYQDPGAVATANGTPVSITACGGSVINLNDASAINNTAWTWSGPGLSSTNIENPTATLPMAPGTVTYSVTATDQFGCTATSTVDVDITAGPTVDDPPNVSVCSGEQVLTMFTGTGANYTWTNSNPAIGLGASGSGDINFPAATVAAVTTGTITVTPTAPGCANGSPQSFTITVNPTPTVNQPAPVAVCSGQPVNVVFSGSGGATFNWTNDNTGVGLGASGTGNISYTAPNVTSQEVANITVTPVNAAGCPGTPRNFTITINPGPIANDPPNESVCAGEAVSVPLTGTALLYNWTNSNPAIGLGASGNGDINFTAANVTTVQTGTITITPSSAPCTGPTQTFTITVSPIPTVVQPAPVAVCAGQPVNVVFSGSGGATFNWTNDNTGVGLGASGTGNISYTSPSVTTQTVANITVTPVNAAGCPGTPRNFTITINPGPIANDPPNESVCAGEAVSVPLTGTALLYNWTNSNPAIGLGASGNGDINFTAANVTTVQTGTITITPSAAPCTGSTQTFTITVSPIPTVVQPAPVVVCAGQPVNVVFSGSGGATFNWTNDNTGVGLGASGTGNISYTAPNVTSQEVANITVTPVNAAGCPGTPRNFTITINPGPTVTTVAAQSVCSGEPVAVVFSGSGTSYAWTNSNISIGLGGSGTGNINFTSANVATTQVGIISVVPSASGCTGPSQNFTITVNPKPTISPILNQTVCANSVLTVPFSGTGSPAPTFSWTNSNTLTGLAGVGTGNISFNAANVTNTQVGVITVTPDNGLCAGNPQNFNITVNPLPTLTIGLINCAVDLLTYSIALVSNGTTVVSTSGIVNNGGGGNYSIDQIPAGTNITITATNATTACIRQQSVSAPNCACGTVAPPTTPNNPSMCEGGIIPALTVSVSAGQAADWYANSTGGSILATGASYTPTGSFPSGIYTFYVESREITTGCVSNPRIPVTLTVNPKPTMNDLPNLATCPGVPVIVNFTGTGNPTFNWSNNQTAIGLGTSGTGNIAFTPPAAPNTVVGIITVVPQAGTCIGIIQAFTVTVNSVPTLTSAVPLCSADLLTYSVVVTSNGTSVTATSGTVTNTGNTYTISQIPAGTNITVNANNTTTTCSSSLLISAPNCNCPNIPAPTNPNNPSICVGQPIPALSVATGSGLSVAWFANATGGTAIGTGTSFTPSGPLMAGTYTYYTETTETTSGCLSSFRTPVVLTVNSLPTISAATPICAPNLLTYSVVVTSNASSLTSSSGTVANSGANTYTISQIPAGTNITANAVNVNTTCTASINITAPNCNCAPVAAPTNPNNPSICQGEPTPALSVNVGTGFTVEWYADPSGGSVLANGPNFTPSAGLNAGTYTFYAGTYETATGCLSALRTPVILTVNGLPTISNSTPVCATDLLTYSLSVTSVGSTIVSTGGTVTSVGGGLFNLTAIPIAQSVLIIATNTSTTCSNTLSIAPPNCNCPPVTAPQNPNNPSICLGLPLPALSVTAGAGLTVSWFSTASGGTPIGTGNSFVPTGTLNAGIYTYYAETKDLATDCLSATRTPVTLTVLELPTLMAQAPVCAPDLQTYTIAIVSNAATIVSTIGTVTNTGASLFGTSPIPSGSSITLTATDATNGCTSTATINAPNCNCPAVAAPNNANDPSICEGAPLPNLSVTVGSNQSVNWYATASGGSILGIGISYLPSGISIPGTYIFYAEAKDNATDCISALRTPVELTILEATDGSIAGDNSICLGKSTTLTASGGSIVNWISGQSTSVINVTPTATTTYTAIISFGGSCPDTVNITVTVSQTPNVTVESTTCDPTLVGTKTAVIPSAAGCDSTITTITTLGDLAVEATAILQFGQYAISCSGLSDGSINTQISGGALPYQYTWNSGQTTANLQNIEAGTYSVTVTDADGCTGIDMATANEPIPIDFAIIAAAFKCGDLALNASINPLGNNAPYTVFIDGIETNDLRVSIPDGEHIIQLEDANGCKLDSTITVSIPERPMIFLPADTTIKLGQVLAIEALTNLSDWRNLVWNPQPDTSCIKCLEQTWTPFQTTLYTVEITDTFGCKAVADFLVKVSKQIDIYVPNVFSPNSDGLNDTWYWSAESDNIILDELSVFDRWGEQVYTWQNLIPVNQWPGWAGTIRGKPGHQDVYVYVAKVKLINGEVLILKGDVTIVK